MRAAGENIDAVELELTKDDSCEIDEAAPEIRVESARHKCRALLAALKMMSREFRGRRTEFRRQEDEGWNDQIKKEEG
jgi:hypothetical protein